MADGSPDGIVTIAQGYPQNIVHRADDRGYDYDLRLYVDLPFAGALSLFPNIYDAETTWGGIAGSFVLSRKFFVQENHGQWTYCDLHCGSESADADFAWIASIEDGGLQKPLEFHPNYRTKWNYHLATKEGSTGASVYADATTPQLSDANALLMKWVKEPSEAPIIDNKPWKPLAGYTKTKPGVEAYIYPSPIVRESKRFYKFTRANGCAISYDVGTQYSTTAYPIYRGGAWLVTASNVTYDGVWYYANITYQWSSVWDTELYGAVLDQPA